MTHIRSLQKAAIAFRNLQRVGILDDRRSQGSNSPVEEEDVDLHEVEVAKLFLNLRKLEIP